MKLSQLYNKIIKEQSFVVLVIGLVITILATDCTKLVQVAPPSNDLISSIVYTNDTKATAALVGIYSKISESQVGYAPGGSQSFTLVAGLSSDELIDYTLSSTANEFFTNSISPQNADNLVIWRTTYQYIYQANAVIEGLESSTQVSVLIKDQLLGEAKFIRAFLYFYLVNFWGDVPYIKTTDYRTNIASVRAPIDLIYAGIISDLQDAETQLPDSYISTDRARPNKWCAKALLARVYLYNRDWTNAEIKSSEIINNVALYSLADSLNDVFLKNSNESLWQLMPVVPEYNSSEGYNFILTSIPSNVALSDQIINGFEKGDKRKTHWVGKYQSGAQQYYFPFKYKIYSSSTVTECSTILRLAEQYLIRAEARAMQNKLAGISSATEDINKIRARAGLPGIVTITQSQILTAIEQERKVELFTEWGHRWLDLKRTQRADPILSPIKSPNWQSTDTLYPIPQLEISADNHLTQNKGY